MKEVTDAGVEIRLTLKIPPLGKGGGRGISCDRLDGLWFLMLLRE